MKKILYILQYILLKCLFLSFQLIPTNLVSIIGGFLFKYIGPFSKAHNVAVSNYKRIFPNLNKKEIDKNINECWEQLGRTFAEISILNKILDKNNFKIKITGKDILQNIKAKKQQVIFFGIHQANWELLPPVIDKFDIKLAAIYRHINNPYINKFILLIRKKTISSKESFYTPKGKESAKDIVSAIRKGFSIILLIDQKDNAGETVKLFNYDAKTQLGFLKIAKKHNLKLVPLQIVRKKINEFNIIIHPSIKTLNENNKYQTINEIHSTIEKWIIENPNQWLWQHKRFS